MTGLTRTIARGRRLRRRTELGYAAVLVALMTPVVFIACAAVSVDTARWYVEAERVQAAADAASLAGVVWMPSDFTTAKTTALSTAVRNGYDDASSTVVVTVLQGDKPSQLKVKVSSTIKNSFGAAIGTPTTTVTRTAVADYAGGLSMGSPCNNFGSDPDTSAAVRGTNCLDVGDFWANVGGPDSPKGSGDAFQNGVCGSEDGCTSGVNDDYDDNGYIYTLDVTAAVSNVRLEVYDPALISVGDQCGSNLTGASALTAAKTPGVSDPATRYAGGATSKYCNGDNSFAPSNSSTGFTNQVATSYTVRLMGAGSDPTRPATWPALDTGTCPGAKTYRGYNGPLGTALDSTNAGYQAEVAATFRRWVTICSTSYVPAASRLAIQVKTNGIGADTAAGHNRFAMRAYSSTAPSSNNSIAIAAFNKMAVYANVKNGSSRFFLTRVPSSTAGQTLNVSLFDIGDLGGATGTIRFVAPAESGITFANCRGVGKVNGPVANCTFTADSTFNGKWQSIYIPIPSNYTCSDGLATGCWVKLYYDLANAANPVDTTSWEASIDGQPVRLVS